MSAACPAKTAISGPNAVPIRPKFAVLGTQLRRSLTTTGQKSIVISSWIGDRLKRIARMRAVWVPDEPAEQPDGSPDFLHTVARGRTAHAAAELYILGTARQFCGLRCGHPARRCGHGLGRWFLRAAPRTDYDAGNSVGPDCGQAADLRRVHLLG